MKNITTGAPVQQKNKNAGAGPGRAPSRQELVAQIERDHCQMLDIFDRLDEFVVIIEPGSCKILFANKAVRDMLGDVTGKICHKVFHGNDQPCDFCGNEEIFGENIGRTHIREKQSPRPGLVYRSRATAMLWPDGRHVRLGLATEITDRKRARDTLRSRLAFERTVSRVSSLFGHGADFDAAVNTALAEMGRLAGAGRAYLFLLRDGGIMDNSHEWCAPGVFPEIDNLQNIPAAALPWWMEKLNKREVIHISDVSRMPPEAAAEKAILDAQHIKSLLVVPVSIRDELCGFIGFDNVIHPGKWSKDNQSLLRVCGEIIAGALDQNRTMQALRESEIRYRAMFENLIGGVAVFQAVDNGEDFIFKDFNSAGERIENVQRESILDRRVTEVFPVVIESGLIDVFRRVWRTGEPERFSACWHADGRLAAARDNFVYILPTGELVAVYDDITERAILEEQNTRLSRKMITALDEERVRMSRELHDELGQQLGALVLQIGCLRPDAAPGAELVNELARGAERITADLRQICGDLRAVDIGRLGIVPMLKRLAREFQRSHNIAVDFKADPVGKNEIPREIGIHIYRIIQESLNNAAQHSGAARAAVTLRRTKNTLNLTVSDNGRGFRPDDTRGGRGLGIPGMKERAALCNGTLRIATPSRGGTRVSLAIPLQQSMEGKK